MTPEEIRAQAIHRVAKAIWGMNHGPEWPWESLIYDDPYRTRCMEGAAVAVDALAAAGLLPTGMEWGVRFEKQDSAPTMGNPSGVFTHIVRVQDEAHARQAVRNGVPINAMNRRVVSRPAFDWREVSE